MHYKPTMSWHLQPQMIHPSRASIHLLYHVAKAKQLQHGSLVDRGVNGGIAASDVRILSKSSRKCTVTGIDQHQINGLDILLCAALAYTIMVILSSS